MRKGRFTEEEARNIIDSYKTTSVRAIYRANRDDWESRRLYEHDVRSVIDQCKSRASLYSEEAILKGDVEKQEKWQAVLSENFPDKRINHKPIIDKVVDSLLMEQITKELIAKCQTQIPEDIKHESIMT